MNFGELKARLRVATKNPSVTELSDAAAGAYINSGYTDLASRYPYHQTRKRCTFDTEVGEEKYQLPTDLTALYRVKNMTHGYKVWKSGDRLVADRLTDGFRSRPLKYVRYRNYIEFAPTPNAVETIEIWYNAVPAILVADADVLVLPVTWHDGVWMRAKWYYMIDRGDLAQKASADADYKLWLSDKPSEIDEETRDMDSGVEMPELTRGFSHRGGPFDDGYFDFRD